MNTLTEWCKDAGPIGPALWVFDGIVDTLSGFEVEESKPCEPDERASGWLSCYRQSPL